MPVEQRGATSAVLVVRSDKRVFQADDLALLRAVSFQVQATLLNAHLTERLQRQEDERRRYRAEMQKAVERLETLESHRSADDIKERGEIRYELRVPGEYQRAVGSILQYFGQALRDRDPALSDITEITISQNKETFVLTLASLAGKLEELRAELGDYLAAAVGRVPITTYVEDVEAQARLEWQLRMTAIELEHSRTLLAIQREHSADTLALVRQFALDQQAQRDQFYGLLLQADAGEKQLKKLLHEVHGESARLLQELIKLIASDRSSEDRERLREHSQKIAEQAPALWQRVLESTAGSALYSVLASLSRLGRLV